MLFFAASTTLVHADDLSVYTQRLLNSLGYKVGAADGIVGPKTTAGLNQFYANSGSSFDGLASINEVVDLLRRHETLGRTPPLRSGIYIENSPRSVLLAPRAPGLTKQRYAFGRRWVHHDWNNDGIRDILYAGVMVAENQNVTGEDTGGWCGGARCRGQMPGPTLYLGQSDGTYRDASDLFIDERKIPGQSLVGKLLVADFNNDNTLDLFLADNGIGTHKGFRDTYFLSHSDGTWKESSRTHLSHSNYVNFDHGGAVGDIDGDGDVDLVLTELRNMLTCWVNDGTGKMKKRRCGTVNAFGIELGDVDNDGDLDLLHAGHEKRGSTDTGILLNDGKGNFGTRIRLPMIKNWSTVPEVSLWDLDQDGDLDLALSRAGVLYVGTGVQIIENLGNFNFASKFYTLVDAPSDYQPKHEGNEWNNFIEEIRFADIDRDGDTDIFFVGGGTGENAKKVRGALLRNDGNMQFSHMRHKQKGNPIKIISNDAFMDDPSAVQKVQSEQLVPMYGVAKNTKHSRAFAGYISDSSHTAYDEKIFTPLDNPILFAKSGASIGGISQLSVTGQKHTYDILVNWAGYTFPVTICMQYYKQFDFTATRASFGEGFGFGGFKKLNKFGTHSCGDTRNYAGEWEVSDDATRIGLKAFLADLNTNGRKLIAQNPLITQDRKSKLLKKLR